MSVRILYNMNAELVGIRVPVEHYSSFNEQKAFESPEADLD